MPVVPAPAEDRAGGPAGAAPRILVRCSFGISQIRSGKASEARTTSLYHRSDPRPGEGPRAQESRTCQPSTLNFPSVRDPAAGFDARAGAEEQPAFLQRSVSQSRGEGLRQVIHRGHLDLVAHLAEAASQVRLVVP